MSELQKQNSSEVSVPNTSGGISTIMQAMTSMCQNDVRDIESVKASIGAMCLGSKQTLYSLIYGKPVYSNGGYEVILGPSIRFAEIVRAAWSRVAVIDHPPTIDTHSGMVTVMVTVFDGISKNMEHVSMVRSIAKSDGTIFNAQMIENTVKAARSIAARNAILAVCPSAIYQAEFDKILKIAESSAEEDYQVFADKLVEKGIPESEIIKVLGIKDKGEMKGPHILKLKSLYEGVKDGAVTLDDFKKSKRGEAFSGKLGTSKLK
jgi:hypothetical protein